MIDLRTNVFPKEQSIISLSWEFKNCEGFVVSLLLLLLRDFLWILYRSSSLPINIIFGFSNKSKMNPPLSSFLSLYSFHK